MIFSLGGVLGGKQIFKFKIHIFILSFFFILVISTFLVLNKQKYNNK